MLVLPLLVAAAIAAAPATLEVRLVDDITGAPVSEAHVEIALGETLLARGDTDAAGKLTLYVSEEEVLLRITHPDYLEIAHDGLEPDPGEATVLRYRMRTPGGAEILVLDEAVGEEIHRTVVTIEELRSVPGTFGDPVRALQTLPGVARPNIAEGSLVVRGAEGLNTAYLVDGMPVPYMFHTLVGRSIVTPGFIDQVDFFPGGMPSRYGEVTQAVVNVRTDTRPVGRTRGHIGVDTLDGTASFEHRINDAWLVRAASRYSWIHAFIWSGMAIRTVRAGGKAYEAGYFSPKYWDLFLDVRFTPTDQDEISFLAMGSRDSLVAREPRYDDDGDGEPDDPAWAEYDLPYDPEIWVDNQFWRTRLHWSHDGETRDHETWIALGPERETNLLGAWWLSREGPYRGQVEGFSTILRHEQFITLDNATVATGAQFTRMPVVAYDFQGVWDDPEAEVPKTTDTQLRSAAWLEPQLTAGDLYIAPGLRVAAYRWSDKSSVQPEPRISVRTLLRDTHYLKAGLGRYTQMPPIERYAQGIGNPDLPIMSAWQASVGAEGPLWGGLSFDASVYGAVMDNLIVRNLVSEIYNDSDVAYSTLRPEFLNVQGHAYGVEGLIRMQPQQAPWWGWVSFTLGRAVRGDAELGRFPGDYDQPVSLTVLGAWKASRKMEFSGRVQVTSGQPYTPLYGVYLPQWAWFTEYRGEINAERYPAFFRIDLRAQKTWETRAIDWVAYLDLYNATNRKNPFIATYNYDYSEFFTIAYLPILPTVGVEARF